MPEGKLGVNRCDMCDQPLKSERGMYVVERLDHRGIIEFDLCSAECLAVMAVGEGHERGEKNARQAAELARMSVPRRRAWHRWHASIPPGQRHGEGA